MNTCDMVIQHLDSIADSEVVSDARVRAHLAECRNCSAELARRVRLRAEVRAAVRRDVPRPGLYARIRAKVREQEHRARMPWTSNTIMLLAAVTVGVFFAAVLILRTSHGDISKVSQEIFVRTMKLQVASAFGVGLGDHLHCAWFRRFPGTSPTQSQLIDTIGQEYAPLLMLVQTRVPPDFRVALAHKCSYDGREFVHITLQDRTGRMSLLITEKRHGEAFPSGSSLQNARVRDFQIAGFESAGQLVYLISELHAEPNTSLLRSMKPELDRFLGSLKG